MNPESKAILRVQLAAQREAAMSAAIINMLPAVVHPVDRGALHRANEWDVHLKEIDILLKEAGL